MNYVAASAPGTASAYIRERCAACSKSMRQRALTVPVAIVVDCPWLEIGLAVSVEALACPP